jgi:hypothetical protein
MVSSMARGANAGAGVPGSLIGEIVDRSFDTTLGLCLSQGWQGECRSDQEEV